MKKVLLLILVLSSSLSAFCEKIYATDEMTDKVTLYFVCRGKDASLYLGSKNGKVNYGDMLGIVLKESEQFWMEDSNGGVPTQKLEMRVDKNTMFTNKAILAASFQVATIRLSESQQKQLRDGDILAVRYFLYPLERRLTRFDLADLKQFQ
ncbi:MAG: hypothetical protein KH703_00525 [Campylobacter gracilis]|uniref:hypothetical protein n=1 Tax=Campylobacter gracilis TaxID=824 RepID=UPI0026F06C47|nr:hypothetical protein [Campylobacter gracilis]MBS6151899.1 hypothetical protein [Campylobacter gracilis]